MPLAALYLQASVGPEPAQRSAMISPRIAILVSPFIVCGVVAIIGALRLHGKWSKEFSTKASEASDVLFSLCLTQT